MRKSDIRDGASYRNKKGTFLIVRTIVSISDLVYYESNYGSGSCLPESFANWAAEEIAGIGNETPAQTMERLERLYE